MIQEPGNPYTPPDAPLYDAPDPLPQGAFIRTGRKVPAGNGSRWLGDAWRFFRLDPFTWVLMWIVFALLVMVAALLPFGSYLLPPLLSGGIMLGCQRLRDTGQLELGDLFSGFRKHTAPLLIQGLLYLAAIFVLTIPLVVIGLICAFAMAPTFGHGGFDAGMLGILVMLLLALLAVALMLPVMAAVWFAPALIVLHEMQPIDAMKASFAACFKNWIPMTVYSVLLLLLTMAGLLTCCLGFLVVGPLFSVSVYTSYRDIFIEE